MNEKLPVQVLKSYGYSDKYSLEYINMIKRVYTTMQDKCEEGMDDFLKNILKNKMDNIGIKDIVDLTFYESCGHEGDKIPILYNTFRAYLALDSNKYLRTSGKDISDYFHKNLEDLFATINGRLAVETILPFWLESKQIYRLDRDFMNALVCTENLELSRDMIEHLPYDHFYIDFSEGYYDYEGAFVNIFKDKNTVKFSIILCKYINNDPVTIGAQWMYKYNDKDILEIDSSLEINDLAELREEFESNAINGYLLSEKQEIDRNILNSLCFQVMCYLSSEEPDIYSEPRTKGRRNDSRKYIKNNVYNNINIDNVGIRYGNAFRKEVKEYSISDINAENIDKKARKKTTPHLRRAHWSHYWVGKGRTRCVTRWIKPTFVIGIPTDATIHKVS